MNTRYRAGAAVKRKACGQTCRPLVAAGDLCFDLCFDPGWPGTVHTMSMLFRPMGLIAGLLAGLVARKIFDRGWASFSDEEPPSPEEEELNLKNLMLALLLEGAVFTLVRGLVDHGARVAFRNYTGAWPGEKKE